YLVTDDDVARMVAQYAPYRPQLDDVSRAGLDLGPAVADPVPWYLVNRHSDAGEPAGTSEGKDITSLDDALWVALCSAPDEGADIAELMRETGMGRSTLYRYLAQLSEEGRASQVSWGRWRASRPGDEAHDD
ncbi:MAG: translocase ftsK, partial [Acidimicrobiaceae bacterium]|nr:translocase ftsK [Acidimicrobiaceae bacterium]